MSQVCVYLLEFTGKDLLDKLQIKLVCPERVQ